MSKKQGLGVFISGNNGASWTNINNGIPHSSASGVASLVFKGPKLFAGTGGIGIYVSEDNGSNWLSANTGLTGFVVHSLAVNGNNIFAGTDNGVYISGNDGANWLPFNTGLASRTVVLSLAVIGTKIFAATEKGVFASDNNNPNWTSVNTGLKNISVRVLAVNGNKLYAGSNQVYSMDVPTSVEKVEYNPSTVRVAPNPSIGSFRIESDNKEYPTEVTITNICGQEVYHSVGNKAETIHVNLDNPAKGLYFMYLKNENGLSTKKIIIQ